MHANQRMIIKAYFIKIIICTLTIVLLWFCFAPNETLYISHSKIAARELPLKITEKVVSRRTNELLEHSRNIIDKCKFKQRNSSNLSKREDGYLPVVKAHRLSLLKNEGNHKQFDKPWSKYNKFLTNQGFLKIGRESIVHEWLYRQVASSMGVGDIVLGNSTIISMCNTTSELSSQLKNSPKFILPVYGILTPIQKKIAGGWDQEKYCKNISNIRALKILFIDHLLGHNDRPANCHTVSGKVYAVDNDGVTISKKIPKPSSNIQEYILSNLLKDPLKREQILKKLGPFLKMRISETDIVQKVTQTFRCDETMVNYTKKLLTAINYRLFNI